MAGAQRERAVVAGAVVRVWARGDQVVGGGFLVGPDLVATCAHVVADAVGIDPYAADVPAVSVRLDFPLARADSAPIVATVERWSPIRDDGGGDVALLRLASPPPVDARMPPVRRVEELWDHGFWVQGFPDGLADGVWSTGLIRGEQGTRWFQLQSTPGEQRIEGGFSGAPVWDAERGAVVGMTVAADRGDTTTAYLIPIEQVLGLDPELLPCPYRGLRPFDEEHAATFYGRDAEIDRLVQALRRRPVVAVAGPSGAGKSSLVRAGLLPRLREAGAGILDFRAVAGTNAAAAFEAAFSATTRPDTAGSADTGAGLVLVVDQFEELAAADPSGARELLARIVALTTPNGGGQAPRAVLTMRWSALDDLLSPELAEVLEEGAVLVAPLDRARLREAIVRPAERAPGLAFEDGLVDRILDDAGAEPGQLPLVESLLTDLWEHREGGYLTLRGYQAAGGVAGAVAQHAEKVVGDIDTAHQDTLRRLFTTLARPDRDGRFVRRPVALDHLPAVQRRLVPTLADGRLLVVSRSSAGLDIVEIAHQALVEHWPRLRTWLVRDREFLAWREQVASQRERWEYENRPDSALLRGATLAAAADWLPIRRDDLPLTDLDYLQRSANRQHREVRRWRMVTAVLAVLVLAAATLSVIAVTSRNDLAAKLAAANAETLGRESQSRAPTDAALAAQLALAAWRSDPTSPQARTALGKSYLAMQSADSELSVLSDSPLGAVLTGGDTAVIDSRPHMTLISGLAGPTPRRETLADTSPDHPVALSPDGHWLADPLADGTLRIRDLVARTEPRVLVGSGATPVAQLKFSPSGDRLVWLTPTSQTTAELRIRDVRSGAEVPHALPPMPADQVVSAWLTSDPDSVLVRYGTIDQGNSRLVRRSLTGGPDIPMPPNSGVVRDGAAVATCEPGDPNVLSSVATFVVTPVVGATPPLRIPGLENPTCGHFIISSDGGTLIQRHTSSFNSDCDALQLTDLTDGRTRQVFAPPNTAQTEILGVFTVNPALSVISTGAQPTVLLAQGTSLLRLRARQLATLGRESTLLPSVDGRFVMATSGDTLELGNAVTGELLGSVPGASAQTTRWNLASFLTQLSQGADGGWQVSTYDLPGLHRGRLFILPARSASLLPAAVSVDPAQLDHGGPLLALSDGLLSALDADTAKPVGTPVALPGGPGDPDWFRQHAWITSRPGHPGQALVAAAHGDLQLWDAEHGRLLATLPASAALPTDWAGRTNAHAAFDETGTRLAVITNAKTITVWNVDTATPLRPPIPASLVNQLVGFDLDGYLDVTEQADNARLAFVDLNRGAEAGSVIPSGQVASTIAGDPIVQVQGFKAKPPFLLPITAKAWRDKLCAVSNRPFTASELAVLPAGTSTDPPCDT